MAYFEQRYRLEGMGKGARLVAMAVAHHRLNYINPFADGNGRVSRLMSHGMSLGALIEDGLLGSVSPKGPVSLRLPAHAVDILFPRLFPRA